MRAQSHTSVNNGESKVSEIIDRVLIQVFGREGTCLIYKHLEHNYSLKHDEVAEKIDLFARGLEEFLSSGAYAIEHRILEDISSTYGPLDKLETTHVTTGFADQMRSIMQKA